MVKLQAAYKMNLSTLINHGKIEYQSTKVGEKSFDSYEILSAVDLITLTAKAKILKMYNVAIDFAKAALELMPKETGNKKIPIENSKKFQVMVKELVKLNNEYLTKSKTIAGKYIVYFSDFPIDHLVKISFCCR